MDDLMDVLMDDIMDLRLDLMDLRLDLMDLRLVLTGPYWSLLVLTGFTGSLRALLGPYGLY